METTKIRIDGIACGGCLTRIENSLLRNGLNHFDFDMVSRVATIDFDENKTNQLQMIEIINAMGYQAKASYF